MCSVQFINCSRFVVVVVVVATLNSTKTELLSVLSQFFFHGAYVIFKELFKTFT